jgi:formylglycine-generating enzyme required for sulfatase activity
MNRRASRVRSVVLSVVLSLVLAACAPEPLPPLGQVLVHVDTDAVVMGDETGRAALFDRLEFALFPPGATEPCRECVRVFPAETAAFRAGKVSFGAATVAREPGYTLRARLFFTGATGTSEPSYAVEKTVRLPAHDIEEQVDAWVYLPTAEVGAPMGTIARPAALDAPAHVSRVGSFGGARAVGCASAAPRPRTVCVPGGAFWMGRSSSLTVVSPFFIDAHEVTVNEVREQNGRFQEPPPSTFATPDSAYCTARRSDDTLPANCVRTDQAQAVCEARGGRLPFEVEWEFVASNLGRSVFPWGSDAPRCDDAIVGRSAGIEPIGPIFCTAEDPQKYPPGPVPVPLDGKPHGRDVVRLAGGLVFDLAGNLSEIVLDDIARAGGPCWKSSTLTQDPRCVDAPPLPGQNARGGSYFSPRFANTPIQAVGSQSSFERGFRCVYPAVSR